LSTLLALTVSLASNLSAVVVAEAVLAVDAASYLAFVICLTALPRRRSLSPSPLEPPALPAAGGLRPAFEFLRRTPAVRATTQRGREPIPVMRIIWNPGRLVAQIAL